MASEPGVAKKLMGNLKLQRELRPLNAYVDGCVEKRTKKRKYLRILRFDQVEIDVYVALGDGVVSLLVVEGHRCGRCLASDALSIAAGQR